VEKPRGVLSPGYARNLVHDDASTLRATEPRGLSRPSNRREMNPPLLNVTSGNRWAERNCIVLHI